MTLHDPLANVSPTFAGGAHFVLSIEHTLELPPFPTRRGGALRPVMNAGKAAGKLLWRPATRKFDWRDQEAEGIVALAARRFTASSDLSRAYGPSVEESPFRRWAGSRTCSPCRSRSG